MVLLSASCLSLAKPDEAALRKQQVEEHEAAAQKALTDSLTDGLAMLKHGSARAKESAAAGIAQMAHETTVSQPFHPVTFRNACVRAGIVRELVRLLSGLPEPSTPQAQLHALTALGEIATDDPTTELDNGHALAVCKAGAVPPAVQLLASHEEPLQVAAANCIAVLAENPQCQTELLAHGAITRLVSLGTYANDAAKLRAVAALDILALNNPPALEAIAAAGGLKLLQGLRRFGGGILKDATSDLMKGVADPTSLTVEVDTAGHARQAHQTRLKHSKVWQSVSQPVQRARAPSGDQHLH